MSDFSGKVASDAFAHFLGITVDDVGEGYAACSVTITKDMLNFLGVVHGGLIFSLADVAFAAAGNFLQPPSFALDVSGSFLKSAQIGDVLRAQAQVVNSTKRTGLYRMDVYNGDVLLATFNGTVFRKV